VVTGSNLICDVNGKNAHRPSPFTIQVPMRTGLNFATSGYVALIFLDTRSKEVERLRLPFEPIEHPIDTLATDAQGRFAFLPDSRDLHASIDFRVEFPGDALHRTASAILHWSTESIVPTK
jgi:hypothetical protein